MKEIMTLGLIILILGCLAFFGIIKVVKKSFKSEKPTTSVSSKQLKSQRNRMKDIQARQKRLMEDNRQKMRDMRR